MSSTPPWLHNLKREQVEEVLGDKDGTFLVRKKGDLDYVLSVVFKGRPTHHAISPDATTGDLLVNGKNHGGGSSIESLIEILGTKKKGWPVALDKPITSIKKNKKRKSASTSSVASAGKSPQWMWPAKTKKPDVEAAMNAKGLTDGMFAVRQRDKPDEWVLSVVFKGKPTHHLCGRDESGKVTVNKKAYGQNWNTIEAAIGDLQSNPPPKWPVPLTSVVAYNNSSADTSSTSAPTPTPTPAPTPTPTPHQQPQEVKIKVATKSSAVITEEPTIVKQPTSTPTPAPTPTPIPAPTPAPEPVKVAEPVSQPVVATPSTTTTTPPTTTTTKTKPSDDIVDSDDDQPTQQSTDTWVNPVQSPYVIPTQIQTQIQTPVQTPVAAEPQVHRPQKLTSIFSKPTASTTVETSSQPFTLKSWGGSKSGGGGLKRTTSGAALLAASSQADKPTLDLTGVARRRVSGITSTMMSPANTSQTMVDRVDNYPRNQSEEQQRVFEVLRELFANSDGDASVKHLRLTAADLGLRFSVEEVRPVLQGLGVFDPSRVGGAVQLDQVFQQSSVDDEGTISMAQFMHAMETTNSQNAQQEKLQLQRAIEEKKAAEEKSRAERVEQAQRRAAEQARLNAIDAHRALQERMALEQQYAIQAKREQEQARLLKQQQEFEDAQQARMQQEEERRKKRIAQARQKWKGRLLPMPWDAVVLDMTLKETETVQSQS